MRLFIFSLNIPFKKKKLLESPNESCQISKLQNVRN